MKLKMIINLFGGPCVGKSLIASKLFASMKENGYNVEYVPEYAKDLTYEGRFDVLSNDQLYVFAKQHRKILRLKDQVDFIVTDSPLLLSIVYSNINPSDIYNYNLFEAFIFSVNRKYNHLNIILDRNHDFEYKNEGRTQNLSEAIDIDEKIKTYVNQFTTSFKSIKSDKKTVMKIMNMVRRLTK